MIDLATLATEPSFFSLHKTNIHNPPYTNWQDIQELYYTHMDMYKTKHLSNDNYSQKTH